ncbi:hypothetical protein KI387_010575, partial [Taxus chinensis]
VNVEVELTDWESDGLVVEVVATVGMEEVCAVEVAIVLVSEGVGAVVVVEEVDAFM